MISMVLGDQYRDLGTGEITSALVNAIGVRKYCNKEKL